MRSLQNVQRNFQGGNESKQAGVCVHVADPLRL